MSARPFPMALVGLLAVALVALAGCGSPEPSSTTPASPLIKADTITPGTFHVSSTTDQILVWVHNAGPGTQTVTLNLTGALGAALPPGWTARFDNPVMTLAQRGIKHYTGQGYAYDDWDYAMLTLTIPAAEPAGTHNLELHAGPATTRIVTTIDDVAQRGPVTHAGSTVHVAYDGHFHDNQARFDQGGFDTQLGSGQTVPGFDNGLIGLSLEETATLVVPPAFAYGYDNPPGDHEKFNGQWLDFTVTIQSM